MALMKCPDCGRDVSSHAAVCLYCGCPASEFVARPETPPPVAPVMQPAPVVQPVPVESQPAPQPVAVEPVERPMPQPVAVVPVERPVPQPVAVVRSAPEAKPAAPEAPVEPTKIIFPPITRRYMDDAFALYTKGSTMSLAHISWHETIKLKLKKPEQLTVRQTTGKSPASGIVQLVVAQVLQMVCGFLGWFGLIMFMISVLLVVCGIMDLCHCGRKTLITFYVKPGCEYELHWRSDGTLLSMEQPRKKPEPQA